ncbi:MAG: YqaA family protein [Alloprevotella sp.]
MMADLTTWLTEAGPQGMFVAAILAGSVFPFSSEVVMMGLLSAGADPVGLLVWGTAGNVLGSAINYGLGRLGSEASTPRREQSNLFELPSREGGRRSQWMVKYAKVSPEKLERGRTYVSKYGAWAGLLAWIPLLGSVVTVAMGFMRTNLLWSFVTIATGKYLRYQIIVSAWLMAD